MALSEYSRQAMWLKKLMNELGRSQYIGSSSDIRGREGSTCEIELRGDNTASIQLVKNNQVSPRLKHVDMAYYFIRELQKNRHVSVSYVPSSKMTADGLTKPLNKIKH